MDPRLREAVDASRRWYDAVFALHGIGVRVEEGLWSALGPPPPWHSAVKTLEPGIGPGRVVAAAAGFEHCAVADSFGDLELDRHGFTLLIDAVWLHRGPADEEPATLPGGWSVVDGPATLSAWATAHDYTGVLPPGVLEDPRFRVLAHHRDGVLTGGAVTHDGGGAVGLSNAWGTGEVRRSVDVLRAAAALHPGRALTDYAEGPEMDAMVATGFTPLGPQRVWLR
jgi:hypothetical protein